MSTVNKYLDSCKNLFQSIRELDASIGYFNYALNDLSKNNLAKISKFDRNTLDFIQEHTKLYFWVLEFFYIEFEIFPYDEELHLFDTMECDDIIELIKKDFKNGK
ncbi:hypothetical protein [Flavobacterium sp. CF136]|uniref:hypothetical protein n=1 Tax=Flavobacterium sp. (strain CF136) TaxID=1144313 RepID=UPI0002719F1E|nr:hypothetical protein [Flavobacterium sp. CF136]EJL66316.1 hypothetical protein PMI10_00664 [Flavobacterium sp. CF136]